MMTKLKQQEDDQEDEDGSDSQSASRISDRTECRHCDSAPLSSPAKTRKRRLIGTKRKSQEGIHFHQSILLRGAECQTGGRRCH